VKILFVYTDIGSAVGYSAGIGILSAILKSQGHETRLIHISDEFDYPFNQSRINKDIRDYQPHLICFSATTNQWHFCSKIGQGIKKEFDIPIIVGGHHAMGDPDGVISEEWVDIVCRGEGDKALAEVVRHMELEQSIEGIPNLLYKKEGVIIREPLGTWVENLDDLPFDDRKIFNFRKIIDTRSGWAEVIVTRGCPYSCSYCFNKSLLDQYSQEVPLRAEKSFSKKDFVSRRRSVDSTITLLKELKSSYPNITGFTFVDDIMAVEGEWFEEFAHRYRDEIRLPYNCTTQPLLFNRRLAGLLADSGCKVVKMGVEAGNSEIRRKVLKRNISNERLIEVFDITREFGLKSQAFNMIGIPGETIENIMETIQLNALIRPYVAWVSTFNPYPGTELYQVCREKDMIDETMWDRIDSYRADSVLRDGYLPRLDFKKVRVMFRWFLNERLGDSAEGIYRENIQSLSALSDEQWKDGAAEKLFEERDIEIDQYLRKKKISHYVSKKYINIYWGKEYNYDLT
jgi:radical SAM superfamily enzyme YgiQ (UPF0313 family)